MINIKFYLLKIKVLYINIFIFYYVKYSLLHVNHYIIFITLLYKY